MKLTVAALLVGATMSAHAGMYQCPTPTGEVEFTDRPCHDGTEIEVVYSKPSDAQRQDAENRQAELSERLDRATTARRERLNRTLAIKEQARVIAAQTPKGSDFSPELIRGMERHFLTETEYLNKLEKPWEEGYCGRPGLDGLRRGRRFNLPANCDNMPRNWRP